MDSEYDYWYVDGTYRVILYLIVLFISLPTLVIKWYFENPKRSFATWWFDVSKTLIGYLVLNAIPDIYFVVSSEYIEDIHKQYCRIKFMGLIFDGILVTFFTYVFLRVFENLPIKNRRLKFITGEYPNGVKSWLYQLWIWVIVIIISKTIVLCVIYIFYTPFYFVNIFLYLFTWNLNLEKIIVLFVAPLIQSVVVFHINVSLGSKIILK